MFTKKTMDQLHRVSTDEHKVQKHFPVTILLDDVRSMNNVGSVFRTADAFNIESIALCGFTPRPPHRDIQKTALGATESVHWNYFNTIREAIRHYQEKGYQIWAVEQTHSSGIDHG
jgi:23S rRNA (guanosine2251-2'-O)-methyltransferase